MRYNCNLISVMCLTFYSLGALGSSTIPKKNIEFEANDSCFLVTFPQGASAVLPCMEPLDLEYEIRNCTDKKVTEKGKNTAALSCPDSSSWFMTFRTKDGTVKLLLNVWRESQGKKGMVANYKVKESHFEKTSQ